MKKFLALSAGAVLAVSMFAFAGCSDKDSEYAIKGDYKEATTEDVNEFNQVNINLGDTTAENFMFGLDIKANFEGSEKVGTATSANGKVSVDYLYNQTADDIKGVGTATAEYSATYNNQSLSGNYNVNLANTAEYAYASLTVGETPLKAKVDYWTLVDGIMGGNNDSPAAAESEEENVNLLELAKQYKIGVYLDKKDGWKVKLSVTKETVLALIDSYVTDTATATQVKENLTFNKFVLDAYLSLDSNGTFRQLTLDVNIDVAMKTPATQTTPSQDAALKLKGGFTAKATTSTVDISTLNDAEYTDYTTTLGGLIGGIMDKVPGGTDNV